MPAKQFVPGACVSMMGGGYAVHPRFLPKLKFYFPLRDGGGSPDATGNPTRFNDWGPSRYVAVCTYGDTIHYQMDGYGNALTQVGDPNLADQFPVTGSQNDTVGTTWTLMGWGRPYAMPGRTNTGGGGNPYKIISKIGSSTNINASLLVNSSSNLICTFTVAAVAKTVTYSGFAFPQASVWRHYAATYDGTTMWLYLDGLPVASAAVSGTPDNGGTGGSNSWWIGRDNVIGGSDGCQYRDVAVWDRVLTADDIGFAYRNRDLFWNSVSQMTPINVLASVEGFPVSTAGVVAGPYIKVRHGGSGHGQSVVTVATGDYTIDDGDDTVVFNSGGTIYLPTAATRLQGRRYTIINNSTINVPTVRVTGGANIMGYSFLTIPSLTSLSFVCDGTNWFRL